MILHKRNKSGYILITALLMLTGLSMLVVSLLRIVWTAQEFSEYSRDRVHARSLALSGVEIAKSQLAQPQEQQQEQDGQQAQQQQQGEQQGQDQEQQYLLQLLTYINRWQAFELTEEQDGIDGTIYIYIAPEQGKIPLNMIFDRENKQLTQAAQNLVPQLQEVLSNQGMEADIKPALEEIAQQPPYFDDPSQLIHLSSAFAFFDERRFIEMDPTQQQPTTWRLPTLYDMLTTFSRGEELFLNPLFFSQSLCTLFGLTPFPQNAEERKQMIESLRENLPSQFDVKQHWDTVLAPYYKRQLAELPESLTNVLSSEHGAHRFSVVSYSNVRGTQVYLYGILERVESESHDTFRVHRVYWI